MSNACREPVVAANKPTCTNGSITLPKLPDISPAPPEPVTPTAQTVTEEKVNGKGVFNVYMRAGMNQLMTQYDQGRIKGADFAKAYTATVELMMTEANKFELGVYGLDIQKYQAVMDARMKEYDIAIKKLTAGYEIALKEQQVYKSRSEAKLICRQEVELEANGKSKRTLDAAEKCVKDAMVSLYGQQTASFKDKSRGDVFKTLSNMWVVYASEQGLDPNNTPAVFQSVGTMNSLFASAAHPVGLNA